MNNIQEQFFLYKGCWLRVTPPHKSSRLNKNEINILFKEGGVVQRDPSDFDVKESSSFLGNLLSKLQEKGFMIRNVYNFDCNYETEFWYIIKDKKEEGELSKKVGKYILKANDLLEIKLISKVDMLNDAYNVYLKAFGKYTIKSNPMSEEAFKKMLYKHDEKYQYWGAYDREKGNMVAFSICYVHDGICECDTSKADPDYYTKYYPLYGIYDARNEFYLNVLKLKYIVTSQRSITQHSNIQDFMIEKFNFRRAYCDLQIEYRWWLKLALNILFPFRSVLTGKIGTLLEMERINRTFK